MSRTSVALILALLLALAGAGLPASVRAADNPNEIPGVPLPAPIVTGRLGGSAIDAVYRIDVAADRVLLLSLTGSPGTDYDLYLFDSSATSIYAPTGMVAKSTGPTSAESLAYSTADGGRFYVDVSSFGETEGTYRLTVVIGNDTIAPECLAHAGRGCSGDRRSGRRGVGRCDRRPQSASPTCSSAQTDRSGKPGSPSLRPATGCWPESTDPRTSGRGSVTYRGMSQRSAQASIVLDRIAPSVVARVPEPGGAGPAPRPVISVRFSEPIRASSWQSLGLIMQDSEGTVVYGTYAWVPATNTGTFAPSSDLVPGATYVLTLGAIADIAGNALAPVGTWTIRPLQAPRLSLAASPRTAARGTTVLLTGSTDGRPGGTFNLERLDTDGTWLPVEPLLPDASGGFFSRQVVDRNTSFRVAYSGNEVSAPTTSPGVRVLVRRTVTLAGPGPAVRRSAALGSRVVVTAMLGPANPATPVALTLSWFDPARGAYRVLATLVRTSGDGRATFAWRASRSGTYTVRVTAAATTEFASGASAAYRWIVP